MIWFCASHAEQGTLLSVWRQIIQHDASFGVAVPFEPYLFQQAGSVSANGKGVVGRLATDAELVRIPAIIPPVPVGLDEYGDMGRIQLLRSELLRRSAGEAGYGFMHFVIGRNGATKRPGAGHAFSSLCHFRYLEAAFPL